MSTCPKWLRSGLIAAGALCGMAHGARAQTSAPESALFTEFPQVQAVSLHPETLDRAPAAVSVITADRIRRYGYRTLADALQSEVGFLITSDHAYTYLGVRGFGLPGDYGSRLLMMVNGHALAEPAYGTAAFFGQEFGVDLEIVERIEVIRGPSSALYGSNGILATINIVTKTAEELPKGSATATVASGGDQSLQAASAVALGGGASLVISAKGYRRAGSDLYLAEYDTPETNHGVLARHDRERGYHAFLELRWKNWDISAMLSARRKDLPVPWDDAPFTGIFDRAWDQPNYVDAVYTREIGRRSTLTWRTYYDWYRYTNRNLIEPDTQRNEDICRSDRIGTRVTVRTDYGRFGALTAGVEGNFDPRVLQQFRSFLPEYSVGLDSNEPNFSSGAFVQWEHDLSRRLQLVAGIRHDWSRAARQFVSPRAALVFNASPASSYKLMWGRAFRNPNANELYYSSPDYQLPSVSLRPEYADTVEFTADHKLNRTFSVGASSYLYEIRRVIEMDLTDGDLWQFRNAGRDRAAGLEWRAQGRWGKETELVAGGSFEHSSDRNGTALPNSPRLTWLTRGSVPVSGKLTAASSYRYVSSRQTIGGATVSGHGTWDLALTTVRLHPDFDLQFGVQNLLNRRYLEPTALVLDAVPASGRQIFLRLFWRTRD